ncbi:MAG: kelch repeat-containing protein [Bacteroidota bacterium]|nr:kelch repeat-containing protein [Bacteroidota bacterium]
MLFQIKHNFFCIAKSVVLSVLFFTFTSCKKVVVPETPGSIIGSVNLCPGESNVSYSINPVAEATYYLWTVPEGAKIVSGQGTTSILVNFGKKIGPVCVRANNDKEVSPTSCLEVKQGGISNQWCQGLNFLGGGRQEGVAFSINNKGYFGTGFNASNSLKFNDFWEYDPIENTWSQKANFPGVERADAVGFAINNKGYVGTGRGNSNGVGYLGDFWEYDPSANQWTKKADYNTACAFCFAFSIGNKGYVGGGTYITTPVNSSYEFYEFDPNNGSLGTWTKKANLLVARSYAIGFSIGGKGYYGLGSDQSIYENRFMEYDPNDASNGTDINGNPLGKWIYKTPLPSNKRNGSVAFTINNKAYVGCGSNGSSYYIDLWEFDPSSATTWTQKTSLPVGARNYAIGFAIGNNGYIGLGKDSINNSLNDFWIYAQ